MTDRRICTAANIGLARLHCRHCAEETLHKRQACIHCGTPHTEAIPKSLASGASMGAQILRGVAASRGRKRGATC